MLFGSLVMNDKVAMSEPLPDAAWLPEPEQAVAASISDAAPATSANFLDCFILFPPTCGIPGLFAEVLLPSHLFIL